LASDTIPYVRRAYFPPKLRQVTPVLDLETSLVAASFLV